jgi:hypothetical protein
MSVVYSENEVTHQRHCSSALYLANHVVKHLYWWSYQLHTVQLACDWASLMVEMFTHFWSIAIHYVQLQRHIFTAVVLYLPLLLPDRIFLNLAVSFSHNYHPWHCLHISSIPVGLGQLQMHSRMEVNVHPDRCHQHPLVDGVIVCNVHQTSQCDPVVLLVHGNDEYSGILSQLYVRCGVWIIWHNCQAAMYCIISDTYPGQ